MMKTKLPILLLILMSLPAQSSEPELAFVITADCVTSAEVEQSNFAPGWGVKIHLDDETAEKLTNLTSKNISKKLTTYDGNNAVVLEATILDVLASPFVTTGIASKEKALNAKQSIMRSTGRCGEKKI